MTQVGQEIKKIDKEFGEKILEMNHLREEGNCPTCGRSGPHFFVDNLSKIEFKISGMCQTCQDKIWPRLNK
jgi:hypothetical protein